MLVLVIPMVDPFFNSWKFELSTVDPTKAQQEVDIILESVGYDEDPLMGPYRVDVQ